MASIPALGGHHDSDVPGGDDSSLPALWGHAAMTVLATGCCSAFGSANTFALQVIVWGGAVIVFGAAAACVVFVSRIAFEIAGDRGLRHPKHETRR